MTSAKSWSMRGASHQPAFMGSCLLVTHVCPFYLVFLVLLKKVRTLLLFKKVTVLLSTTGDSRGCKLPLRRSPSLVVNDGYLHGQWL